MTGIERLRNLIDDYRTGHECKGIKCGELSCGECMAKNVLEPIATQIEREQDATVADSPYDALPPDERDAIAWVREHGGIAYVKDAWNVRSNLDRQLERAQAKVERQQRHIEFVQTKFRERQGRIMELRGLLHVEHDNALMLKTEIDWLREMLDAIADRLGLDARYADSTRYVKSQSAVLAAIARLVSDGEWPRFEDGEPVLVGSDFADGLGEVHTVTSIEFFEDGVALHWNPKEPGEFEWLHPGERVKRPTPKVLDADGAEIELGDDLYSVEGGLKFHVSYVDRANGKIVTDKMFALDKWADPKMYTHRAPVLAADGLPLREGETVWGTGREQHEYVVLGQPGLGGGTGRFKVACHDVTDDIDCDCDPSQLTHERPVADSWERLEEDADGIARLFEGMDEDASADIRDLVRRAKALAERDA